MMVFLEAPPPQNTDSQAQYDSHATYDPPHTPPCDMQPTNTPPQKAQPEIPESNTPPQKAQPEIENTHTPPQTAQPEMQTTNTPPHTAQPDMQPTNNPPQQSKMQAPPQPTQQPPTVVQPTKNPSQTAQQKNQSRKKLTPRKPNAKNDPKSVEKHTTEAVQFDVRRSPRLNKSLRAEIPSAPVVDVYVETESESEDDDSADDENYKIDPRDLNNEDEEEETGRRCRRKLDVNDSGVMTKNAEGQQDNEDSGGDESDSDDSVEDNEVAATELQYDDEELNKVRRQVRLMKTQQRNTPMNESQHQHEVPAGIERAGRSEPVTEPARNVNHKAPNAGTSHPTKWLSYYTTFERGYMSDQRESDDEGPLSDEEMEDEEAEQKRKTKKEKK